MANINRLAKDFYRNSDGTPDTNLGPDYVDAYDMNAITQKVNEVVDEHNDANDLSLANPTDVIVLQNGVWTVSNGSAEWGNITGDITFQTDLIDLLAL